MKNNNFRYNDLVGIMFYDEDDNPTPASEMVNKDSSNGKRPSPMPPRTSRDELEDT